MIHKRCNWVTYYVRECVCVLMVRVCVQVCVLMARVCALMAWACTCRWRGRVCVVAHVCACGDERVRVGAGGLGASRLYDTHSDFYYNIMGGDIGCGVVVVVYVG